jgi:hypothetical protein
MKAPTHIQTSHQICHSHDALDSSNQFTIPTNARMKSKKATGGEATAVVIVHLLAPL